MRRVVSYGLRFGVRRLHKAAQDVVDLKSWQSFVSQLVPESVPKNTYQVKYVTSSGPGGQHVNKTATKAQVTWNSKFLYEFLPKSVSAQILSKNFRYLNDSRTSISISCDETRSRTENAKRCFFRLFEEIEKTVHFSDPEKEQEIAKKWTKVHKAANEKRLELKKKFKQKKELRKKVDW